MELKISALILILTLLGLIICFLCYLCCCRARGRKNSREDAQSVVCKNNEASPITATTEYKRVSKMSNLEAVQHQVRPASYATVVPDNHNNVTYNVMHYTNNLDTHRNYNGSASEELVTLPPELRKLNHNPMIQQMVNINNIQSLANTTANSDPTDTTTHKQNKWDQIHLQTFNNDKTKINNDKRLSPHHHHQQHHHYPTHYKQGGILPGRLMPSPSATYAGTTESSAAYDWDVSDWKPRSLNVLSNITEVPGSEVVDSSSFHSNESNESHTLRTNNLPGPNGMMDSMASSVDQLRNGGMLSENLEIDFPDLSSECDRNGSENPLSITFDNPSMSHLNHLDSGSDGDYRFNTGKWRFMFFTHIIYIFMFSPRSHILFTVRRSPTYLRINVHIVGSVYGRNK